MEKKSNIGLAVSSYWVHKELLKICVDRLSRSSLLLVCSYNYGNQLDIPLDVVEKCDVFCAGSFGGMPQGDGFSTKLCLRILEPMCEYVFKLCDDVILSRPENISLLVNLLGDYDLITPQWHTHKDNSGTKFFFGRTRALKCIYERIDEEKSNPQLERRFEEAILSTGVRRRILPITPEKEDQVESKNMGIWGKLLGLVHTHETSCL